MPSGVVRWFDSQQGVGVIACDDGKPDVGVEWCAVQSCGDRVLARGDRVVFNLTQDRTGTRADNVHRVP